MTITTVRTRSRTDATPAASAAGGKVYTPYSNWFYLPSAVIYGVLFVVPTFASFYFSLTRWSLFDSKFIG
ncbi:MAG TPA: sugar ABC transporter permease, partial [Kribbella sp.]